MYNNRNPIVERKEWYQLRIFRANLMRNGSQPVIGPESLVVITEKVGISKLEAITGFNSEFFVGNPHFIVELEHNYFLGFGS